MNVKTKQRKSGFTLVELLVVVAIIALLVTAIVASFENAKAKARDAERVSEINSINTALGFYHNDYNMYPIYEGYITGSDTLSEALKATGYINTIPTDPTDRDSTECGALSGYHYYYQSTDGKEYILGFCLETNSLHGRVKGDNYLSP